jgi:hypothetical protein
VVLPLERGPGVPAQSAVVPAWQRWNDYGIGCLLEGGPGKKGHYKQAAAAFLQVTESGAAGTVARGRLNRARVFIEEGNLEDASRELRAAAAADPPADWWSLAWFGSLINSETATSKEHVDSVITELRRLTDPKSQPEKGTRNFDFSPDRVVLNRLANLLFRRSQFEPRLSAAWTGFMRRAVETAGRVLTGDPENVEAHDLLKQCYTTLGVSFAPQGKGKGEGDTLPNLCRTLADADQPREARLTAATRAVSALNALRDRAPDPKAPRLPVYRESIALLGPTYLAEKDEEVASAVAHVLGRIHQEVHAAYRPDESARSRATQIYREHHPAANHAAGGRVIYPTTPAHRQAILKYGNLQGGE